MSFPVILHHRRTYAEKLNRLFGASSLVGYWKLDDRSGSVAKDSSGNGRDGTHTAVTLAQPGIGDGGDSVKYDGTTSVTTLPAAGLDAALGNKQEGSIGGFIEVNAAGVWTDATFRGILRLGADANNFALLGKSATSNTLDCRYVAGSVVKQFLPGGQSSIGWLHLLLTWSKSADKVILYINGIQNGATLTGVGTWAGALVASACVIGANSNVPVSVMSGYLAHLFVLNRAATPNEAPLASQVAA